MDEIHLFFAGDFSAQGRNEPLVVRKDIEGLLGGLTREIKDSHLAVVDLEAPLVTGGTKRPKTGPHLLQHPGSADFLVQAGVGLVAMANNHIMDYEAAGLSETLRVCRQAGLAVTGVGQSLSEARSFYSTTILGRQVAIINVTENEWSNTHGDYPGANPADAVWNFEDIRKAKASHEIVIMIYHGGNEHYPLPSPRIKSLFRFYAEAGASAVIAHHTHIISGFEVYRGVPLFYGLGNFLFDWPGKHKDPWNLGMAVRLKFGQQVSFDIIPFRQSDDSPGIQLLGGIEKEEVLKNIETLNATIGNDQLLAATFDRYCAERAFVYDLYLEPYRSRVLASLRRRKWLPSFLSPAKRRLYLNIIRCEAHREVLLHALKK